VRGKGGLSNLEPPQPCRRHGNFKEALFYNRVDNLPDPIGTTASAVSILDRAAAIVRWIRGRRSDKRPAIPRRPTHKEFEVRPVVFHLDLTQSQPRVELRFYAMNYLRRDLVLTDARYDLDEAQDLLNVVIEALNRMSRDLAARGVPPASPPP
jgi:hypothetical protein